MLDYRDLINILVISGILNIFFIMGTIMFPQWLRIAFSKSLMIVIRNDRVVDIVKAKFDAGAFRNKSYGLFKPEPEDIVIFNKKPCIIAYSPYSKPVRAKIMPLLRKLKELGLETYDDLRMALWVARNKHFLKANGGGLSEEQLKLKEQLENIPKKYHEAANLLEQFDGGGYILNTIEVVRLSDLVNYIDEEKPLILEGMVEREVTKERRKMRSPISSLMPYVIMFLIIIIGAAIAWKIVASGGIQPLQNAVSNLPINVK